MEKNGFLNKKQMDHLEDIGFKMDNCDGWIETISGSKKFYFSSTRSPFDEPEDFDFLYHTLSLGRLFAILPKFVNGYKLMIRVMHDCCYKVGYFDDMYNALYTVDAHTLKDGLYLVLLYLIEGDYLNNLIKQKKNK